MFRGAKFKLGLDCIAAFDLNPDPIRELVWSRDECSACSRIHSLPSPSSVFHSLFSPLDFQVRNPVANLHMGARKLADTFNYEFCMRNYNARRTMLPHAGCR